MWFFLCLLVAILSFSNGEDNNTTNVETNLKSDNNMKFSDKTGNIANNTNIKASVEMERIIQPMPNQKALDPVSSNTNISTKVEKVNGKSLENVFRPSPKLEESISYEYNKFPVQPAFPEPKHLNNFNIGEFDNKQNYRPEFNVQWPSKGLETPVLTTETPWTSRVKFPTTPAQRSHDEHHHHHHYYMPSGDNNKYLPPDGNKYLPPDGNKYLPPDGNKYLPPDGNKYLPPTGNKYLPPDGNKYFPPDGNKYLPPDGNKYLPPDGNKVYYPPQDDKKYLPPDSNRYFPPSVDSNKYQPPGGNNYLPPSTGTDNSYQGKYGPPSGTQTQKHWLDGPNYRPSGFGSVSNVPISTSVGVWNKYEKPAIGPGYDRRPPISHKTQYDFTSYERPYIEPSGGSKFDIGKPLIEPPMSPWKKIIKILTAFIPIGLLISALTPTVINVTPMNNTNEMRLRAEDPSREAAKRLISSLTYFNKLDGERCEDRILCELLLSASNSKNAEENVKNLLNNFTEQDKGAAERAEEMRKIFEAVRDEDCSSIICNTIKDT